MMICICSWHGCRGSEIMVITQQHQLLVVLLRTLWRVSWGIKLGNNIKTCCYAMNFKRCLTSPILNSVWIMLMVTITNAATRKIKSPCEDSKGMTLLCTASVIWEEQSQLLWKSMPGVKKKSFLISFVRSHCTGIWVFPSFLCVFILLLSTK